MGKWWVEKERKRIKYPVEVGRKRERGLERWVQTKEREKDREREIRVNDG